MALPCPISTLAANTQADIVGEALSAGYLAIYSGRRPATPDDQPRGCKLLAEQRFGFPACPHATDGTLTFYPLAPSPVRDTGRATWFRCLTIDRNPVFDGDVSADEDSGAEMVIAATTFTSDDINAGKAVVPHRFTYRVPRTKADL